MNIKKDILENTHFLDIKEITLDDVLKNKHQEIFSEEVQKRMCEISHAVRGFSFTYLSGNHRVGGMLSVPNNIGTEKIPVIIYNRGGYKDFSSLPPSATFRSLGGLAEQGYCVIASQYSGNSFSEGKDEYGGSDIDDVIRLYDIIKSFPFIDTERIGMYGGSRGAVMTYRVLAKVNWIKAVCIVSGLTNLFRMSELRPKMQTVFNEAFGASKEEMEKRSVVFFVDQLPKTVPVLIFHGGKDERVHIEDALETDRKMTEYGIPHQLVVYPTADHFLTGFQKEKNKIMHEWFERFLKK